MPQTNVDTPTEQQPVFAAPDGKKYKFPKGTTQQQASYYFSKSTKFQKASKSQPKATPKESPFPQEGSPDPQAMLSSMSKGVKNLIDYPVAQAPNVGGMIGSTLGKGGVTGAAMGWAGAEVAGYAGDLAKTAGEKILYGKNYGPTGLMNIEHHAAVEAMHQGNMALQGAVIGEALGATKYIPAKYRLQITNGVRRFPWEVTPGKAMNYLGNLLENLFASSGTIEKQRVLQTAEVQAAGSKLANAFSKFRGNSEEMGQLVQKSIEQARQAVFSKLGKPPDQALIQKFNDDFFQGLISDITGVSEKKTIVNLAGKQPAEKAAKKFTQRYVEPSTVAGLIRGGTIEGARQLRDILGNPEFGQTLNSVKTIIFKDGLDQAMKDQRYIGADFNKYLDKVGKDKLEVLLGDKDYKATKDFADFTRNINGGVNGGVGRWLNFGIAAGIFYKPVKAAQTIFGVNVIARMMSTTEGTAFLKNYEVALASKSPQIINAASDGLKTYMSHVAMEERAEETKLKEIQDKAEKDYLNSYSNGGNK